MLEPVHLGFFVANYHIQSVAIFPLKTYNAAITMFGPSYGKLHIHCLHNMLLWRFRLKRYEGNGIIIRKWLAILGH
jgi:hypothetical protein